jgi:hypothetical protein
LCVDHRRCEDARHAARWRADAAQLTLPDRPPGSQLAPRRQRAIPGDAVSSTRWAGFAATYYLCTRPEAAACNAVVRDRVSSDFDYRLF